MEGEWISINEVLETMERQHENGIYVTFSIGWVRNNNTSGGARGSIKHVRRAAKYTNPAKRHVLKTTGTSTWQFKTYNTIPIQDRDNDKLQTPKITHIVEFNGKKVQHYGAQQ